MSILLLKAKDLLRARVRTRI